MSNPRVNPLLGRAVPALTPIRTGGASGAIGSFGPTRVNADGSPKMHKGIDLLCAQGWPVFACHGGTVTVAGFENEDDPMQGFGRRVKIESADGKTRSVYAHLSYINVTVGQKVEDGFIVGLAGRSGNVGNDESKVPTHLHCEIQEGDGHGAWTPRDPGKWMMGVDT